MTTWMICSGHGDQLADGVSDEDLARCARAHADRLGAPVFASPSCDNDTGGAERTFYPTEKARAGIVASKAGHHVVWFKQGSVTMTTLKLSSVEKARAVLADYKAQILAGRLPADAFRVACRNHGV